MATNLLENDIIYGSNRDGVSIRARFLIAFISIVCPQMFLFIFYCKLMMLFEIAPTSDYFHDPFISAKNEWMLWILHIVVRIEWNHVHVP